MRFTAAAQGLGMVVGMWAVETWEEICSATYTQSDLTGAYKNTESKGLHCYNPPLPITHVVGLILVLAIPNSRKPQPKCPVNYVGLILVLASVEQ